MICSNVTTSSAIAVATRWSASPAGVPLLLRCERLATSRHNTPAASWSFM